MTNFHSNFTSKKCQKQWFLMAKSSFSWKSPKLDKKMTKNDQNLITKWGVKIGHNLTTKRGDSGSAGLPEKKCVIIGAPNLVTKSDTNWSQTLKMIKKCQKSTKQKKCKNTKIIKTQKVTKHKNTKSSKVRKWKSEKVIKKCEKVTPSQNGQNVT